jgi:colanic acid/amylovoran biosynthesis glycosyltransferase
LSSRGELDTPRSTDREQRPRVLILTTTLPAMPGDGTPEFVLSLARSLSDRYEITVLAPRVRGSRSTDRVGDVAIQRFPYFPRPWEGLADGAILPTLESQRWRLAEVPFLFGSFLWQALRLARRKRPDVVHAHWLVPAGLVALALKSAMRIPYVLTVHGADAYALRGRLFTWLKRRIAAGAGIVSTVSEDLAASLDWSEDGSRPPVVPMGVDVDAIQSRVSHRAPAHGRFLFVGRLAEKKGVDVLIRAVVEVPDATVVVVGDGPESSSLRRLVQELGLESRVQFAGRLSRPQVLDQFSRAYGLVIPSKVARSGDREGTPVVLAEAMAAGVPVVASNLGGLAEHIRSGETGFLVTPGSPRALSAALRKAMADPDAFAACAQRAEERIRTTLDIGVTRERYEQFFEAAMRSSGGRGNSTR